MFVLPATSSQSASRPTERRRNPRHRAPSIIYVQLGSENGGIVVNLGIDGVAFQAAMELTAEKNSTFNLRLRGSGLNAELVGELVWLGATQKEAGICFKSLSAKVQQDIADWIERQTQVCETAALGDRSGPKPMPAMPGTSATGENLIPHSLSAALAMSRAVSADIPSSEAADANESCLGPTLDSATGVAETTPLPEITSPIQQGKVPSDDLDDQSHGRNADSLASPELCQVQPPLPSQALFELPPIEHRYQSPAFNSSPVVLSEAAIPLVPEELPQASAETLTLEKDEFRKTDEIDPIPGDLVPQSPGSLLDSNGAERWIPPALLAAWRLGNRQRRLLLAGTAAACLGIFALILILAVAHIDSILGRSVGSGSQQQSTVPPATSLVSVVSPQIGPLQAPPAPRPTVRPRSPRPSASLFAKLAGRILGYDPDASDVRIEIGKDQVGVQVWTSKSSGYYYCTDSPYYKSVQPGTFKTQGDALQSGYQPKLGEFCD